MGYFEVHMMYSYARIKGGLGVRAPQKNHKNIGFLSNTCSDPLKITKLSSQHSMLGHHRHASETPFKAFRSQAEDGPLIVVFGSSYSPHQIKYTLSKLGALWQNFLDPHMIPIPNTLNMLNGLQIYAVWTRFYHIDALYIIYESTFSSTVTMESYRSAFQWQFDPFQLPFVLARCDMVSTWYWQKCTRGMSLEKRPMNIIYAPNEDIEPHARSQGLTFRLQNKEVC